MAGGGYAPGGYAPQPSYPQQQVYPGQEQGLTLPRAQPRTSMTSGMVAMTVSPTPQMAQVRFLGTHQSYEAVGCSIV